MQSCSLQSVRDFHSDLLAVVTSGVAKPDALGFAVASPINDREFTLCLIKLESRLERAINLSQDVPDNAVWNALSLEERVTDRYRAALEIWCRTKGSPLVFELASAKSNSVADIGGGRWLRLVLPLVWLVLGYLCLIVIWLFVGPSLLAFAADLKYSSSIFDLLAALDSGAPIWMFALPILVLSILIWCKRYKMGASPKHREAEIRREGIRLKLIAVLSQFEVPTSEALHLTRKVTETHSDQHPNRPLLQWAIESENESQPRQERLELARSVYSKLHQMSLVRNKELAPDFRFVLLGGLVVLGIGILLFLPVFQLISHAGSAGVNP